MTQQLPTLLWIVIIIAIVAVIPLLFLFIFPCSAKAS